MHWFGNLKIFLGIDWVVYLGIDMVWCRISYSKTCLIPLFHTGPESHELPQIDKYLGSCLNCTQFVKILTDANNLEFLQFVGLSGIRLKSFEQFKTLATNSLIRKIVRDLYQIPMAFLDIVTES